MHFKNRSEAGKLLAQELSRYKNKKNVIVMAIPRGGVVVGHEISKSLKAKLDILVTKKIGAPNNEEFAIGSVGPDKKPIINEKAIRAYGISRGYLKKVSEEIGMEIERRYREYKGKYSLPKIKGRIIIIADDGIATGMTVKAAIRYAKNNKAGKIIVAVPVAPLGFEAEIKDDVDDFVCLYSAVNLYAVGQFYDVFEQLDDRDVKRTLKKSA